MVTFFHSDSSVIQNGIPPYYNNSLGKTEYLLEVLRPLMASPNTNAQDTKECPQLDKASRPPNPI